MIRAALALFALEGRPGIPRAGRGLVRAPPSGITYVESAAAYNLLADDAPALIAQPLSIADEATPAATGVMAGNAATLFMLTGDASYREHAERIVGHLTTRSRPGHHRRGQPAIGLRYACSAAAWPS